MVVLNAMRKITLGFDGAKGRYSRAPASPVWCLASLHVITGALLSLVKEYSEHWVAFVLPRCRMCFPKHVGRTGDYWPNRGRSITKKRVMTLPACSTLTYSASRTT